ncbi:MAG: DUF805 domain-containing protein [Selenomonadaceae bacterium]|nr:DUF805 domain-containing protein [Selenomonadaceae bacterium]
MDILEKIYTTEGRLNRGQYIKYMILLAIMGGVGTFVTSSMATFLTGNPEGMLVKLVTAAWGIAAVAGNIMLMIRRLHDLNKSGYFVLVALIPVIGFIFSIYLFCAPGQVGWNQYGADPLES